MPSRSVALFVTLLTLGFVAACQTSAPPPTPAAKAAAPAPTAQPAPAANPAPAAPAVESKPVSLESARNIANNCFTCHGPDGRSPGSIPSLSRLSAERIASKLKDFKSGAEPSTVMGRHAKAYTDAELEAVAKYIATAGR